MGPLVINEIMYHPPDLLIGTNYVDDGVDEYIEIYNITTSTVFLYDTNGIYFDPSVGTYANGRTNTWRLDGMVNFDFPTNVSLAPGHVLLLVNFSPTNLTQLTIFRNNYGVPAGVPIFGPYNGGKLKNSGGSVELYKPDPPQGPQHPDFKYVPYILVDRVNFSDSAPWPGGPDGTGLALQRIVPERYGNEPTNWAAANPTPGKQYLQVDAALSGGNSVVVSFRALAGSSYSIQGKHSLEFPTWANLMNFAPQPASSVREFTDTLTSSNRFYRLVTPSQ
jgi:hypothetical protein